MKATPQEEKILRREIYALRRELRRDISKVKELALNDVSSLTPTYAIDKMKSLEKEMRKYSVRKRSTPELVSLNRQLKYIRNLKTSTPEGALKTKELFQPIRNKLSQMTEDERKEWYKAYDELYNKSLNYEKFKYEIFDFTDKIFSGDNTEYIVDLVTNAYKEAEIKHKEETDEYDEDRVKVLLTEILKQFL